MSSSFVVLKNRGINLTFEFAGPGDVEMWRARAMQLEVGDRVRFLGLIPNRNVRKRMIENDIIVVPSRHDYAEGLPNTIYEALASRTPLVISDHPAFRNRLQSGENCLVFRAADPVSLADRITTLLRDATVFARLSAQSAAALYSLFVGMNWTDVSTFLARIIRLVGSRLIRWHGGKNDVKANSTTGHLANSQRLSSLSQLSEEICSSGMPTRLKNRRIKLGMSSSSGQEWAVALSVGHWQNIT